MHRLLLLSLITSSAYVASAQEHNAITCAEHLVLPKYSPIARIAGPGTAQVFFLVAGDGSIKTMSVSSAKAGLETEIKMFMHNSRFKKSCAGDVVSLEIEFAIEGEPIETCPYVTIVFDAPNRFKLITQPTSDTGGRFVPSKPSNVKK